MFFVVFLQLTYDYKFDFEDDENKIACLCGAPNCRKWMNWNKEMRGDLHCNYLIVIYLTRMFYSFWPVQIQNFLTRKDSKKYYIVRCIINHVLVRFFFSIRRDQFAMSNISHRNNYISFGNIEFARYLFCFLLIVKFHSSPKICAEFLKILHALNAWPIKCSVYNALLPDLRFYSIWRINKIRLDTAMLWEFLICPWLTAWSTFSCRFFVQK